MESMFNENEKMFTILIEIIIIVIIIIVMMTKKIIMMFIFKCYFSREHIATSKSKTV